MELKDYLNVIRARRWVIVQAVLIVTVTALVASFLQTPQYEGEARVLITERDTGAALLGTAVTELSGQPERALQTQVQLMRMRPLLENTIRELNLGVTPDALAGRVTVSAVGQTHIIKVTARDGDPKRAATIANTLAAQFVQWSREYKRESIAAAADEVDIRLMEAQDRILVLGRRIKSEGKSDDLAAELQIAVGAYTTLAEKLESLRIQEQLETGSGRVVSPAAYSGTPVSPKPMRNGVLGLAVGLVFGLGMAFLYEYLDNTLKSTEETERIFGAPVLGMIPLEMFDKDEKRRLTIVQHPGSPAAEAYRVLRNSLDFINFEHDIKTLLVTSAVPIEGKSTVAANLAASLAQTGKKVTLVSCDFRRPTTETFFGVQNIVGLSEVLLGTHTMKAALQRPGDEMLLVMTSGKMPPNPSELLGSHKMKELLESLGEWADWIILDTPPLLAVADPAAVARWADGVLMVTRAGVSTRDAAAKGREMLEKVGARIIGSVVWGLEESHGAGGYGYYGGYYGQYYYAGYYQSVPSGRAASGAKRGRDSGAKATVKVRAVEDLPPPTVYLPEESGMRKFLGVVGKVLTGVLALLAVLAVLAVVTYFLDQYFGWGILELIGAVL